MSAAKRVRVSLTLLAALSAAALLAGEDALPADLVARLAGDAFTSSGAYEHLRVLSDEIGPRVSATAGARRAVEYAERTFRDYGLAKVHVETFLMTGWERGPASAEMIEPYRKPLAVVAQGWSPNAPPDGLTAELVDVGYGSLEQLTKHGEKLRGKVALYGAENPPWGDQRVIGPERLAKLAAAGVAAAIAATALNLEGNFPRIGVARWAPETPARFPVFAIGREDTHLLRRLLDRGKVVVRLSMQNRARESAEAQNVVAELPGRERPEEAVIVGAHLDSWDLAPGVQDNGVGSALVLEAARLLRRLPERPRRTIRFILFTGEEQGLHGSYAYVRAHESELDNIVGMMNLDVVGVGRPTKLTVYARKDAAEAFAPLVPRLRGLGVDEVATEHPQPNSDFFPFLLRGLPTWTIGNQRESREYFGHTAGDTLDKVSARALNENAVVAAAVLFAVADRTERPAPRLSPSQVKEYLQKQDLERTLRLWDEWPF